MSGNRFPTRMNSANTFPQQAYGPAGFNDNNFNRAHVPSNIYPPNGGMLGNPLGNYNPTTSGSRMNQTMSRLNESYGQSDPIIDRIDYTNQKNIIHNNIGDSVLDEHIVEYRINIDSLDRDIRTFPNQFDFRVKFNPPSSGILRTESVKKGKLDYNEDKFTGAPDPHIGRDFRNVKYIKLDSVVLPQHSNLCLDCEGVAVFDNQDRLVDDRYVIMAIPELDMNRIYSTSDDGVRTLDNGKHITPPRAFGYIFPDKSLGRIYYIGTPYGTSRIYNNSRLGNINQLSIKFYDSVGQLIKYNGEFTAKQLEERKELGDPVPLTDLRHPLNKNTQVYLSFIIGVAESQINNDTKFEH
jgi:hypothetical protein